MKKCRNDLKATWKILNLINKRKLKLSYPACSKNNGKLTSDPDSIANSICASHVCLLCTPWYAQENPQNYLL